MRSALAFAVLLALLAACDQLNKPMASPGGPGPLGAPAPAPHSAPGAPLLLDAGAAPAAPDGVPTAQPGDIQL